MSETGNSQWHGRVGLIVGGVAAFGSLLAGLAPYISGRDQPAPQTLPPVERAAPAVGGNTPALLGTEFRCGCRSRNPGCAERRLETSEARSASSSVAPNVPNALGEEEQATFRKLDRRLTALENRHSPFAG